MYKGDKIIMTINQLIKKADLVKYCWFNNRESSKPLWCADYLLDEIDRNSVIEHLYSMYDLERGVYLYKSVRNQFKLIAIITDKGVKEL